MAVVGAIFHSQPCQLAIVGPGADGTHRFWPDEEGSLLSRYLDLQYKGTGELLHVESDVPDHSDHTGITDFAYDHRRQLTREVSTRHLPSTSTGYDHAYDYDNAGNPTSWQGSTRTFNADNQETTGGSWTYDGNGNPTRYVGTTCTYDVENHLTAFGTNFTAGYRGDGLRAWQDNVAGKTYYLYDGWRPVQELDSDGTPTKTYTFGANGLVAYGLALDLDDWQGNAVNAWTEGGTPVTGLVLDAWGAPNAAYKWQHGYGGGGTELVFCTYRYLDPTRGRWVTRDPIGYGGGIGLYAYVGNGPVRRADPSGHKWIWWVCAFPPYFFPCKIWVPDWICNQTPSTVKDNIMNTVCSLLPDIGSQFCSIGTNGPEGTIAGLLLAIQLKWSENDCGNPSPENQALCDRIEEAWQRVKEAAPR